jgi:hypothetical protein
MGAAYSHSEMNAILLTVGSLWLISLVLMFRALARSYAGQKCKFGAKEKRSRRRSWPEPASQPSALPIAHVAGAEGAPGPIRRVA